MLLCCFCSCCKDGCWVLFHWVRRRVWRVFQRAHWNVHVCGRHWAELQDQLALSVGLRVRVVSRIYSYLGRLDVGVRIVRGALVCLREENVRVLHVRPSVHPSIILPMLPGFRDHGVDHHFRCRS